MDFERICKQVCDLVIETAKFIKNENKNLQKSDVEIKGLHNFVTYVDKESERRLVSSLKEILPGSGFIVEEESEIEGSEEFKWIIDPLDGTTNFIHSIPCYSISVALMQGDKMRVGVVYEINLEECFYAWNDSPAYLNGKEIRVSNATLLSDSLIATGFPYYDYGLLKQYLEVLQIFMKRTHGVRRLGSAAVDLVYVAAGRFEGFYEYGLNSWDVAAGAFIVERAGGIVTDFKGIKNYIKNREIIAASKQINSEMLAIIKSCFNSEL